MIIKRSGYNDLNLQNRIKEVKAEMFECFDQTGELPTMAGLTSEETLERFNMTKEEMEVTVMLIFSDR